MVFYVFHAQETIYLHVLLKSNIQILIMVFHLHQLFSW